MSSSGASEAAGGDNHHGMSASGRSPYVLAVVLVVIVLSWGLADLVRGNHDPLVLGATSPSGSPRRP